jgi:hypothetical protein
MTFNIKGRGAKVQAFFAPRGNDKNQISLVARNPIF